MDLTSRKNIKDLLKKHQLRPLKHFGQNFLIDKRALRKIVAAADLSSQDTVLEIGPGIGALTQELAKKAGKVIAVEKDRNMVDILKETLKDFKNVQMVKGDILKILNSKFIIHNSYKVVANLPYYIVAPVIRKFLEMTEVRPQSMILMVQKEVAQRICAKPPHMSLLAVSVQFYATPEIISYVSKKSFWPQPKVDAAIIKIIPSVKLRLTEESDLFFKIVKAGFSQPRKQLINNLSKALKIDREKTKTWLLKNKIQPTQRAETLSIDDWLNLTKTFVV